MRCIAVVRGAIAIAIAVSSLGPVVSVTQAQTTQVRTEYLMTYMALVDQPVPIDGSMMVANIRPGGWVKGPRISGTFAAPGGDWLRILPSGVLRLDIRALIRTDDNASILLTYNGIIQNSSTSAERLMKGEVMTTKDIPYFVTAPTLQTSSEKYAWLNGVQLIGKLVEVKVGEDGYVKYDVFIVH
jgi:hypothetical protein